MLLKVILSLYFTNASNITVERMLSIGTPPVRQWGKHSVYFQGNLYYFGGVIGNGDVIDEFHMFNVQTELWKRLAPIDDISPMSRGLFAMYATDAEIFVHGGQGPNGILNDLWSYDATVNFWQKSEQHGDVPPPFYRPGFTAFDHNNVEYLAMGCYATEDLSDSNELYLFNTNTRTWRKMPKFAKSDHSVPAPRRLWNLNYHNGFVYLWGGNLYEENAGAQLYRYDLTLEQWESITVAGQLPQTRILFFSCVYKDALYIFPGWVSTWDADVDETFRFDLTQLQNPVDGVWEELQIQKVVDYHLYFPSDSHAATLINNNLYIHGGYSYFRPLSNNLMKLDLDQSPIGLTVLGTDVDIPSNRFYSTLTFISGKFYMFGGSTGSKVLDELWAYDENLGTWSLQDTIGDGPGARQSHSAVALGNNLIIWGGKNGSNFYGDLHMYNTLTNIWEVIEVKSQINPTGAEGACMETYNDDVYIFGGKSKFRSHNYVWKFNLGSNKYTLLSEGNYNSPTAASYSTCYVIGHQMHIMYGVHDDGNSPSEINIFDLETYQWTISELTIPSVLGRVASGKIGPYIIIANGSRWVVAKNEVWVIDMDSKNIQHMLDLDWYTFAESSVYYKNSFYVFGGGDSHSGGVIRQTRSVDRWYKINFPEMPCSVGTYKVHDEWLSCPKGTYKDTHGPEVCAQCALGTYNEQTGSTDIKQCLPCPEGMFNPQMGSHICLKCQDSDFCPAGSVRPQRRIVLDDKQSDVQPPTHESHQDKAEHWSFQTAYYFLGLFCLASFIILFSKKLEHKIKNQDIFIGAHNHKVNKTMKTRKTFIGGMGSLIVYGGIAFLTIQALLYYFYDNIEEIKTLIPIVVLNEFVDSIKGNFRIKVSLTEYGGMCVNELNDCMPEITYAKTNIKGVFSKLSCTSEANSCQLQLTCNHWVLDRAAQILFSSYETSSYATSISVEVTSKSSVPDLDSQITSTLSVESGGFFWGSEPTILHFQAIPSVFESEISNEVSQETGYHLALGDQSQQGSSYTVENLAKTRFLHTQITFSQGYSALQTTRTYKIRSDVLIIGIIGGVAGVIELVALTMSHIEEKYEKWKKNRKQKQIQLANLKHSWYLLKYITPTIAPKSDDNYSPDLSIRETEPALPISTSGTVLDQEEISIGSNRNVLGNVYARVRDRVYDEIITPEINTKENEMMLAFSENESLDLDEISIVVVPI